MFKAIPGAAAALISYLQPSVSLKEPFLNLRDRHIQESQQVAEEVFLAAMQRASSDAEENCPVPSGCFPNVSDLILPFREKDASIQLSQILRRFSKDNALEV